MKYLLKNLTRLISKIFKKKNDNDNRIIKENIFDGGSEWEQYNDNISF